MLFKRRGFRARLYCCSLFVLLFNCCFLKFIYLFIYFIIYLFIYLFIQLLFFCIYLSIDLFFFFCFLFFRYFVFMFFIKKLNVSRYFFIIIITIMYIYLHDYHSCYSYKTVSTVYVLKTDSHIQENFCQTKIFPSLVPQNTITC